LVLGLFAGCTTTQTLEVQYNTDLRPPQSPAAVKVAVLPFENATWNGLENPYWIGRAGLYGIKLLAPVSVSHLVTQGVKKELASYGYQLSTDEIYSIQVNRNDLKTLLRRIPHIKVDYLVGGVVSHFFIQQVGRFIGEVEIEAYLVRPPYGDIVWSKKIGHREVRIAFPPDEFAVQSQAVLNRLLERTLKDLFRHSDFRMQVLSDPK
jgi:TolB-like protein